MKKITDESLTTVGAMKGAFEKFATPVIKKMSRERYAEGYKAGVEAACAALPCEISTRCRCPSMAAAPCESCAAYHRIMVAVPMPVASPEVKPTDPSVSCVHGVPLCVDCAHEEYEAQTEGRPTGEGPAERAVTALEDRTAAYDMGLAGPASHEERVAIVASAIAPAPSTKEPTGEPCPHLRVGTRDGKPWTCRDCGAVRVNGEWSAAPADARLIAAAPELLDALHFIHEHAFEAKWSGDERGLDLVEAAIAKAEGRAP